MKSVKVIKGLYCRLADMIDNIMYIHPLSSMNSVLWFIWIILMDLFFSFKSKFNKVIYLFDCMQWSLENLSVGNHNIGIDCKEETATINKNKIIMIMQNK